MNAAEALVQSQGFRSMLDVVGASAAHPVRLARAKGCRLAAESAGAAARPWAARSHPRG